MCGSTKFFLFYCSGVFLALTSQAENVVIALPITLVGTSCRANPVPICDGICLLCDCEV